MHEGRERIRIGLLTAFDPRNRVTWASWTDGVCHMMDALEHCGGEVVYLGPAPRTSGQERRSWPKKVLAMLYRRTQKVLKRFLFLRKYFIYNYRLSLSKSYAQMANQLLRLEHVDIVFAPASSTEVVFLDTDIPIVLLEDATFAVLHDYYPQYTHLPQRTAHAMDTLARQAIHKADLLIYASRWAARSAIEDYQADAHKVHVVPLGANLDQPPTREVVLQRPHTDHCTLLFLGVDWERKGGAIAFETLLALHHLGIPAELIICGCIPPKTITHDSMRVIPFLQKKDPVQRAELEQLYITADFLLLPTRSECYGLVFCEANAYGLPVITTRTGGVAEVVHDNENGFLLPFDAGGEAYAEIIAALYQDRPRYEKLVRSSRTAFEERLNWDVWGAQVSKLIENLLAEKIVHTPVIAADAIPLPVEQRA